MLTNRLEFLKRKNKGRGLLKKYEEMFVVAGLNDLQHVDLEESDNLICRIRNVFPNVRGQFEMLPGDITAFGSKLLTKAFLAADSNCYMYSDDVYYCGMYLTSSEFARKCCLKVAKLGYSNTCFLLDKDLKFSIRINFYSERHDEHKNKFDIQLKQVP